MHPRERYRQLLHLQPLPHGADQSVRPLERLRQQLPVPQLLLQDSYLPVHVHEQPRQQLRELLALLLLVLLQDPEWSTVPLERLRQQLPVLQLLVQVQEPEWLTVLPERLGLQLPVLQLLVQG